MELRQYGVATTLYFPLIDKGATDFESTPVTIASGDCKISKDGGAFANTTTASFSHVAGGIYSIPLTATEMQAKVIVVKIVDQTGTKEWEDQAIVITTCNHASAEVPTFAPTVADIRTAVGLASANLDTQLGAIDDFLDTEVAAIKAKTDNLPADPADASDIASSFTTVNTKLDAIDDFIDTEVAAIKAKTDNLPADPADASDVAALVTAVDDFVDTEIAAIKAKTDLIPAAPAAVGDIPTAIQNADALLTRDIDTVEGTAPVHSLTSMILKLVSRFVAGTGRTYRTDGTTVHMTQTPTTDPLADPVTELGAAA